MKVILCAKNVFLDIIAAIIEISEHHSEISMSIRVWTAPSRPTGTPKCTLEYTIAVP
jgi:hypothetical protein